MGSDGDIDLSGLLDLAARIWWKVALFSVAVGALALAVMLRQPNVYTATAVIAPAVDERRQLPPLGALASLGIDFGGPSTIETLETVFRSNDLAVRVFKKHDLWPVVFGERFDPAAGTFRSTAVERLFGGAREPKRPGSWDAVRAAQAGLRVAANKRAGTVAVSFESLSPEGSEAVVRHFLDEGKSRLQEEALERASRNKKFIGEQLSRTMDMLARDRLYTLYGQETEREMMARNREQFGFKVVDNPMMPDRKSGPQRAKTAVLAALLSALPAAVFFGLRGRRKASPPSG